MQAITTIGLDIAKSVFQVHGVDAAGQVVRALPSEAGRFRRWRCSNPYRIKGRQSHRSLFRVKRHTCGTNLALKTSTK
jgi:hypothetical protein